MATTPPGTSDYVFSTCDYATLFVPKGSSGAYKSAKMWKDFSSILEIDITGDVNGDGEVNINDINVLIDKMISGEYDETYDLNDDGEINLADLNLLIDIILRK